MIGQKERGRTEEIEIEMETVGKTLITFLKKAVLCCVTPEGGNGAPSVKINVSCCMGINLNCCTDGANSKTSVHAASGQGGPDIGQSGKGDAGLDRPNPEGNETSSQSEKKREDDDPSSNGDNSSSMVRTGRVASQASFESARSSFSFSKGAPPAA